MTWGLICFDQFRPKTISRQASEQSELPQPIPRNSVESDHGCTSRNLL